LKTLKSSSNKTKEDIVDTEEKKTAAETSNYHQFVGFLIDMNLSYSQIEKIGKYIQKAYQEKKFSFVKPFSFDQRLLSDLT